MSCGCKRRQSSTRSWLFVAFSFLYTGLYREVACADPASTPSGYGSAPYHIEKTTNGGDDQVANGLPIFRIDKNRWFDVTIDPPDQPQTAHEIEESRNRDNQHGKDKNNSEVLPDPEDMIRDIRIRFHYRFN